jgi:hypothetical protein
MRTDRYTKGVLTVIAAALAALALNPWIAPLLPRPGPREARAQAPAPAPAPPAPVQIPGAQPIQIPPPPAFIQWWDECAAVSKETVPAAWGSLVTTTTGAFVFVADDVIRLVRFAPFEVVTPEPAPGKKPCKVLEIKRTK